MGRGHRDSYDSQNGRRQLKEAFANWFELKARGDDPLSNYMEVQFQNGFPKAHERFQEILDDFITDPPN